MPTESEQYIRDNLFQKSKILWDTKKSTRQVTDSAGVQKEALEPSQKAMMLMARYYELKYGTKIMVVGNVEDLEAIKNLVEASEKSNTSGKFGFVLPNVIVERKGFFDNQPFSDLAEKLIPDAGHVCPVIYEKLPDGRSSIIVLDSLGMGGIVSEVHTPIIDKISNSSIPIYINRAVTQRSTAGCRELSILMLKDALRIPSLVDELGFTDKTSPYGWAKYFDILPEPLLKYLQTGSPWKTANVEAEMLRSSPKKDSQTLEDYNYKNRGNIYLGNEVRVGGGGSNIQITKRLPIEQSVQSTKLLEASELMIKRVVKLCEFYEADTKEKIDDLIENIAQTQINHSVKLPENLPSWSHAHEWLSNEEVIENSIFANKKLHQKLNYQLFSFFAKNLNSPLKPMREHAQKVLDPFASQVKQIANGLIDAYQTSQITGLCEMVKSLNNNPEKQQEFINAFNEEIGGSLVLKSFMHEVSSVIKIVKSLNFNQKNNPLIDLILRCKISDESPYGFETQVADLCRVLAQNPSAQGESKTKFIQYWIDHINEDLDKTDAGPLTLEDFIGTGSDNLKQSLRLLGYDQPDRTIKDFLKKYQTHDILILSPHYNSIYPIEVFKSYAAKKPNLAANLDQDLYKKIVTDQELSEEEVTETVRVISDCKGLKVDDSVFEDKKELREFFRKDLGKWNYGAGLFDLSYNDQEEYLEMAYQANNQEIIKIFWDGEIMPVEELNKIVGSKAELEKKYSPSERIRATDGSQLEHASAQTATYNALTT